VSKFKIKIRQKVIKKILKKEFKKILVKNFEYVFIFYTFLNFNLK
tara:strand:- start:505 stop:639 length:135 start_codon:yes stop_codon:yes gene_type:complete